MPSIRISPFSMPTMEGLSAAHEIRHKLKLPIILLISRDDADALKKAGIRGITSW
jgi:CheY-like chemotaxis protein